jgi:hypothetical protein
MIISYIYTNQKTKDKVKSLVNNNLTNSPIFKENLNHIFFNNIKDLFNNIINSKINILVLGVDKEQEKEIINKLKNIYKYNSNEDKIILHTNTKQIEDYGLKNIIHVDKNNYDDLIYFINVNIAEQEMFSPKGKYSILHMKTSFEREIAKLEQQSRLSFKEKQKFHLY